MNDGATGEGKSTAKLVVPTVPRLILWKSDLCSMLGVKLRTLHRMISAGEIPAPDRRLRGRPAWLARSIHEWAEHGCPITTRHGP